MAKKLKKADRKAPINPEIQASVKRGSRSSEPVKFVRLAHTLTAPIAKQLREVAYHAESTESGVMEFALERLFAKGTDAAVRAANDAGLRKRR